MPTISETIRLRGDGDVTLTIEIGSGQIGASSVLLDSEELKPQSHNQSKAVYRLGRGADLRYSILIGTVKVFDVNQVSDQTTVTATIAQGTSERVFRDHAEAPTNGSISYGLAISFA